MTPERITTLTQELIDRGELPKGPPQTAADRIRRMQLEHGIGVDSEEYSFDAFLWLRKQPPEHFGLECEGLSSLPYNPHFRRVEKSELRPGDLCMLRGRIRDKVSGARDLDHFAIVYSYELVTPEVGVEGKS